MKCTIPLAIIILSTFIAVIPSAATEDISGVSHNSGISYTITPTGETDEYKISIEISNITAGGLSLEFPGSFEITDTNIPNGHYGSDGETFIATLTGEKEIYLDVVCPNLAKGEILETWEDLSSGTRGGDELSVSESEKEQETDKKKEENNQNNITPKESPFGFSGIFSVFSIIIAGLLMTISNREDN